MRINMKQFLILSVIHALLADSLLFSSMAEAKEFTGWRYKGSEEFTELYSVNHPREQNYFNFSFTMKWKIGDLLSEPVELSTVKWKPNESLVSGRVTVMGHSTTFQAQFLPKKVYRSLGITQMKVRMRVLQKNLTHPRANAIFITLDPGVLSKPGEKYSFNIPGSPAWSKFFYWANATDGFSDTFREKVAYLNEKSAKKLYKDGFKLRIDSIESVDFNVNGVREWLTRKMRDEKVASLNLQKLEQQKRAALAKINARERKSKKKRARKSEEDEFDDLFASFGDALDPDEREASNFESERRKVRYRFSKAYYINPFNKSLKKIQIDNKKKKRAYQQQLASVNKRGLPEKLVVFQDENTRKYGYKDQSGKIAIRAQYIQARSFKSGQAYVVIKEDYTGSCSQRFRRVTWAYINRHNRYIEKHKTAWESYPEICLRRR